MEDIKAKDRRTIVTSDKSLLTEEGYRDFQMDVRNALGDNRILLTLEITEEFAELIKKHNMIDNKNNLLAELRIGSMNIKDIYFQ